MVPHGASLLQAAVSSGDDATIRLAIQTYKERHPECLVWQHHIRHGLWDTFPGAAQQQIAHALARGEWTVTLTSDPGESSVLDLNALTQSSGKSVRQLRYHFQTVFLYQVCVLGGTGHLLWAQGAHRALCALCAKRRLFWTHFPRWRR